MFEDLDIFLFITLFIEKGQKMSAGIVVTYDPFVTTASLIRMHAAEIDRILSPDTIYSTDSERDKKNKIINHLRFVLKYLVALVGEEVARESHIFQTVESLITDLFSNKKKLHEFDQVLDALTGDLYRLE